MTTIYDPTPYYGYQYGPGDPMRTCVRDLQALELLRAALHVEFPNDYTQPLYIYQGAYHDGGNSAGTHLGSSVYDLHPSDFEAKARLGAALGIVVFHRLYNWDGNGGGEHLHCLIRGGQQMAPEARKQVADWDNHIDGLAGHDHKYDTGPEFPWFPVKVFTYHAHGKGSQGQGTGQPPGTPRWPGAVAPTRAGFDAKNGWDEFAKTHPHLPAAQAIADDQAALWRREHDFTYPPA